MIERSVIVCETEILHGRRKLALAGGPTGQINNSRPLFRMPTAEEKKAIEAALAEAGGRVSGPAGAAARLGLPPSTLDSKIKSLKINKHRFKSD